MRRFVFLMLILSLMTMLTYPNRFAQAVIISIPADYPTIQQGIDVAINGDTVLVADGIYKGMDNVNLDFKGKAITLKSKNGAAKCIIDCEKVDKTRGLFFHSGETPLSVLDGFTIKNGNSNSGGGIACNDGSPKIINNIITENMSNSDGGGIQCLGYSCAPIITNNIITKNQSNAKGGGIVCTDLSSPVIKANTITKNSSAFGGGIGITDSSPTIDTNIIKENISNSTGGGISFTGEHGGSSKIINNAITSNIANSNGGGIFCDHAPTIINNIISLNTTYLNGGGICCWYASPTISNNAIFKNKASNSGGGIFCLSSSLSIINNTITENEAVKGGAIYCVDSFPMINNTIFWNDKPQEILAEGTGINTISYSDIQGGKANISGKVNWLDGNINANPLFVNAASNDYHLSNNSPCINAGTITLSMPEKDIEGNPRPNPQNSKSDIGAYGYTMQTILSIGLAEASLGSQFTAPLNITDATGISSGDITIKYDPSILSVGDIKSTPLTTDMNLAPNTSVSGQIKIAMAGTKAIPSGSGSLIDMSFTVNSKATVGTEAMIRLVDTELYDESGKVIPMNFENGTIKIIQSCIKGDVNNDGNIKSNDATLILRIAAGLLEPNDYQKCASDVNGDGHIRSNDATIVLRKAAGLEAPVKDFIADRHINISLSETHGLKGETISVPITVDNIDILSSGDMSINYDSKVLRAIGILSNDGLLMANNISQPGLIRISFAGVDRLNDSKLAEIRFEVLTDDVSPLTFKLAELYGTDALPLNSKFTNKQFRSWAVAPELSVLLQNYPNPFNPETWIPYQLHESGEVVIRIHNVTGELVRELRLGYKSAGQYMTQDRSAYWDGRNEAGERVSSGVYFYNIQAGNYNATMKMIVKK
jgi:hypothetical protein